MLSTTLIIGIFVFIFGTILGSFLNVIVLRFGIMTLKGRSKCFSCSKKLNWYELIPIFSYIIQIGRCRKCKSKISLQYIFTEIITGLVFLGIWFRYGQDYLSNNFLLSTLFLFILLSISLIISFYDFKHKVVPGNFLLIFIILSFLTIFFKDHTLDYFSLAMDFSIPRLSDFLSGILLSAPFFFLSFFSKERLMGHGDPILILGIGFLLGLSNGLSAVLYSFWIGTIFIIFFSLSKILFKKRLDKNFLKIEVPFTPFLLMGVYLVLITNFNIINFF